MIASMLALLPHADHDHGAHHLLVFAAGAAVGFLIAMVARRSAKEVRK